VTCGGKKNKHKIEMNKGGKKGAKKENGGRKRRV
jgi:hypothetical protein